MREPAGTRLVRRIVVLSGSNLVVHFALVLRGSVRVSRGRTTAAAPVRRTAHGRQRARTSACAFGLAGSDFHCGASGVSTSKGAATAIGARRSQKG